MIFHKNHTPRPFRAGGFTLIEAVIAISVLGIGVASTVGALTKFNALAGTSRNSTGAYTVVTNQIDLFQSISPFNPQKTNEEDGSAQIPKFTETTNNPSNLPTYDMTIGTHVIGYKDPTTGVVTDQWPVYQYKNPANGTMIVVKGTLTVTVSAVPAMVNTYMAVVTISYKWLNRDGSSSQRPPYSFSVSTIRTSDI